MKTRIVMLGTGDFALPTFLRLLDSGHEIVALVTQPDRPQGRKQLLIPSPIKLAALERKIGVEQPEAVNSDESLALFEELRPDLLVTAAYGQILSSRVLSVPRFGGINLHGSILPSYRGASPVARAIQNGETVSGVTVIQMSPRVDAGGTIAVARTPIDPDETAGWLESRLASLGAPLILAAIDELIQGTAVIQPQDRSLATKAPKLIKEDGVIDWSKPALAIHNLVRAMQPWPTASTVWTPSGKSGERLIVHATRAVTDLEGEPGRVVLVERDRVVVGAGQGSVSLIEIQLVGKKRLGAAEFLRGNQVSVGDRLGG